MQVQMNISHLSYMHSLCDTNPSQGHSCQLSRKALQPKNMTDNYMSIYRGTDKLVISISNSNHGGSWGQIPSGIRVVFLSFKLMLFLSFNILVKQ